jgi:S-(hydroxymethyl)glutathione dehydrogenase/alcohol dehydrogenase
MTVLMMPPTMKAAILIEQQQPLVIDVVDLPENLEYGQVCVKVEYSGICGSQLGEIAGVKGPNEFLPHLLGHEGSGIVVETGQGVKHVTVGDHVVLHWMKGNGIESVPPKYSWQDKILNAGNVTTFNEYAIVSENRVTPIPQTFPMDLAPLFGCAVTTGLGVVNNNAQTNIGESFVVFGAGGVGLNVIQGASLSSAFPIIAIDLYDNRLELAKRMGATHVFNSGKCDVRKKILNILGETGADIVVDNTGNTIVIKLAYEITQAKGKTILVGVPRKGDDLSIYSLPLHFGKQIIGSHGGETQPSKDIPRFIRLYKAGKLELSSLITERFSLDDINVALDRMRNGEVSGRCLVAINE